MPRGGARRGKPGKSYGQRVDLNTPAPGQTYGKAKAQQEALRAVPMQRSAPVPSAPPTAPAQQAAPPPDLMGLATDSWQPLPGSPGETARPDEPTTAGLSLGPGAGPESLPQIQSPESPDLVNLIPYLPFYERLASHPDASAATRIFYRSLYTAAMRAGKV